MTFETDVDSSVQEGSRRQYNGARIEANAHLRDHARDTVASNDQIIAGALEQPEIRLILEPPPNGRLVQRTIRLGPRRPHRRSLGAVENPKVDSRLVGRGRHGAAERVDLLDQVTLADAADRRIAAHLPQRFDRMGEQKRRRAHARSGKRRLGAGMAAADDDHVEMSRKLHHGPGARPPLYFPSRCSEGRAPSGRTGLRRRAQHLGVVDPILEVRRPHRREAEARVEGFEPRLRRDPDPTARPQRRCVRERAHHRLPAKAHAARRRRRQHAADRRLRVLGAGFEQARVRERLALRRRPRREMDARARRSRPRP